MNNDNMFWTGGRWVAKEKEERYREEGDVKREDRGNAEEQNEECQGGNRKEGRREEDEYHGEVNQGTDEKGKRR